MSDKELFRYAAAPRTVSELFVDVFPIYDHEGYTEEEKLAMIWACALMGKKAMDSSSWASGVLLKASLNRSIREKKAKEESNESDISG